ncbi:hypothetical protein [Nocardioides sp. SYSU DS0651]|uniref:hypothetical protein n=1 Tax=Nocardioides sp. SYSU DS0651 TaxID=3415955 RepID=UPI003F4B38F1
MTDHRSPRPLPPGQMPLITDQISLELAWRALMGQLGFAAPQLWMMLLAEGRCLHLVKTEGVPEHPTAADAEAVLDFARELDARPEAFAHLYARPGGPRLTPGDLAWARGLTAPGGWPVHVANDHRLRVVAPDDLAAAG